jgi:anti-anti-sigma factor
MSQYQGSFSSQPAGGKSQVLMLDGDFDRSNAQPFEQALDDALHADRPRLIVDLRGVSFLDSTMLRALIRGLGDATARGGQLALIRPNATVWRMFVLTGLSQTLPTFGRLDEALASFALPPGGAPAVRA